MDDRVWLMRRYYGIDEVMVFGDARNDVSMLECIPNSYAVENAIKEAKDAAKYTCGSNDDDGVARCIEREVLSKL